MLLWSLTVHKFQMICVIHIKYRDTYRLWKKCIVTPLDSNYHVIVATTSPIVLKGSHVFFLYEVAYMYILAEIINI
jgi:hypothetical protein